MVDYGLYCDTQNCIRKRKASEHTVTFDMVVEEQGYESTMVSFVNNCDSDTLLRLKKYFDRMAPMQELLHTREVD